MKKLLTICLTSAAINMGAVAAASEVDPAIHKLCIEAKDYLGCVKAMTGSSTPSNRQSVDIDMIRTSGNSCPSTHAYSGAGYCEKVICIPNYRGHDSRLGGKGWSCRGGNTLQFAGSPLRATSDERCPLVEPEVGKNNSCQNGLSEDEINKGFIITESKAQRKVSFGFVPKPLKGERALEILRVIPGCAFAKAGFLKGDELQSFDGQGFSIGDDRYDYELLGNAAKSNRPVRITYTRNGISANKTVSPSLCSFPKVRYRYNTRTGESIILN
ncbi:hypothetical protein [Synechococcus sp. N19]|uniref:hypothetical protein n=1 Tax=Synechococcus sp. N19 TaxID=2575512 RepID=UPI0010BE324C|nr:hypothetical protein [Synechococcus sp. N19]